MVGRLTRLSALNRWIAPLRLGTFLGIWVLVWLPLGLPLLGIIDDPNDRSIILLGLAYGEFLILLWAWGRWVGQRSSPLGHYGLIPCRNLLTRLSWGWLLGTGAVFGIYLLQTPWGWVSWHLPQADFLRITLEGFGVALGVGLAEESLFRGWMFTELRQDYGQRSALGFSSGLFAALHFIKPWPEIWRTLPQFPGLVLLALILGTVRTENLGACIGIHGGLVWGYYLLKVGHLVSLNDRVSPWITGVDGNPLAGLVGLAILALWWGISRQAKP